MKLLKYILSAAVVLLAACNHDPDGIVVPDSDFSIVRHGDVVADEATADEQFTLVWSPARFGEATDVRYTVTAPARRGGEVELAATAEITCSWVLAELLRALDYDRNGDFRIPFKVTATAADGRQKEATAEIGFSYSKISYAWMPGSYVAEGAEPSRLLQYPNQPDKDEFHSFNGAYKGFVQAVHDNDTFTIATALEGGTIYGAGTEAGTLAENGAPIALEKGLYFVEADLDEKTLLLIPLHTVSLVGEAVPVGWDAAAPGTEMTYNDENGCYEVILEGIEAEKSYAVIFNHQWQVEVAETGVKRNIQLCGAKEALQTGNYNPNLLTGRSGEVKFTLNLYDWNYTIRESDPSVKEVHVTGDFGDVSWTHTKAPVLQGNPNNDTHWGYVSMYGLTGFKFTYDSPDGVQWVGGAVTEGDGLYTATLGGGDNMTLPEGIYRLDVNMAEMTATFLPLGSVGLVGAFNGWDVKACAPLERAEDGTFTADLTLDGEFKVIFDGAVTEWKYNLGGDAAHLVHDGSNLKAEAGDYHVVLDLTHTPSLTLTRK